MEKASTNQTMNFIWLVFKLVSRSQGTRFEKPLLIGNH